MDKRSLLLLVVTSLSLSVAILALSQWAYDSDLIEGLVFSVLNAIAGTMFGVGAIGLVNEFFLSKNLLEKFNLLSKQKTEGIQDILTEDEARVIIETKLKAANKVLAIGLAFRWMLQRQNVKELMLERIKKGCDVKLFMPNPNSTEVVNRMNRDQKGLQHHGVSGLKQNFDLIGDLVSSAGNPSNLLVRVYSNYPSCSIVVIDDDMFVSPYLVGSLGVDSSTLHYKGKTKTTIPYFNHLKRIEESEDLSVTLESYVIGQE